MIFSRTPLHMCAGHPSGTEMSCILVEHGARICDNSIDGTRPLDLLPVSNMIILLILIWLTDKRTGKRLQLVQNFAAWIITGSCIFHHTTPLLRVTYVDASGTRPYTTVF